MFNMLTLYLTLTKINKYYIYDDQFQFTYILSLVICHLWYDGIEHPYPRYT